MEIGRLIEANSGRFKTELAPTDKVDTSRLQQFKDGVILSMEDRAKPEVNFNTVQVPTQYKEQAENLYQEGIRSGLMRLTQ